jgi:hypothetical protein
MKRLDNHNIASLSKMLYRTEIMPSGDSKSFIKLSKKLILCFQDGYSFDKTKDVISSELITTYGLSVNEKEVEEITELVKSWYQD